MPEHELDALLEIFAWVGFGLGFLLLSVAVIMFFADGTWLPARAMIEDAPTGRVARWFTEQGSVGHARLTHEQERTLGGADEADIYYRRGDAGRMRLTAFWPALRAVFLFGISLTGLGMVAVIASWVVLFARA
ncbi:hypothetical protein [Microbacterium sp. C7(2022)]|uniref:hypothetical protein n=1 Tax=Microbacterium sp. C7(2022) TaxID=2992759 RepID=UPI00237AF66B|nr:hypothetical protein [Microbacterium sp. C7(2022)]MDE0545916.1 hypothetical protein [Microbacterium sp. C7(2022)]